jgi:hypothetical protein
MENPYSHPMRCRRLTLFALAFASFAQAQSLPSVNVRGTVIDAATSLPLGGVRLTLTGVAPSVLPASSPSRILPGSRVAVTDSAGGYEILGVAAGEYRLFVRRLGYQPALVDLDARRSAAEARFSFGLLVVPIRLDAIQIDGTRSNLFGHLSLSEDTRPSSLGRRPRWPARPNSSAPTFARSPALLPSTLVEWARPTS